MKAQYHRNSTEFRVIQRGTLFYVQRRVAEKGDREHDLYSDIHRGTDHDTAMSLLMVKVAN